MLKQISWSDYLTCAAILLICYYLFIGLKYFRSGIPFLGGGHNAAGDQVKELPAALLYEKPDPAPELPERATAEVNEERLIAQSQLQDADELIGSLRSIIGHAAEKPFAPETLIKELKIHIDQNRNFRNSPHRPAINEMIVSECERTGTALFTEEEVNQWWFS